MAQKKLLFALVLSSLMQGASQANEGFEVDNIINNFNKMPIAKIASEPFENDEGESLDENPHLLRIFVSNSMPRPLLKAYALEAKKYNGALIFKGLPDGSFKAMSELVQYISKDQDQDAEDNLAIQIDDEAFDKFGVTAVPTFVLSQERECTEAIGCQNSYDKISGNIGIKAALEKFAESGELKEASAKILQEAEKQ
jgi:type-F conjugative transfer system pilin assembly protein TrbC